MNNLDKRSLFVQQHAIPCVFPRDGSSWVILSPIEQSIKAKIEKIGIPLKDWDIKIYRGILTGCNEAFIIDEGKRAEILANCKTDDERKRTDALIRPILRGRDIKRYRYEWAQQYIITTFPSCRHNIDDFPSVKDYFIRAKWRHGLPDKDKFKFISKDGFGQLRLEQSGKKHIIERKKINSRKKTNNQWFETQDQIGYWDDFSKPKIVWIELVDRPSFALDETGIMINNTIFFITGENIHFLLAYLNSMICDWQFGKICATSGTGTRRWIKQYIEQIRIPFPNPEMEKQIREIVKKINAEETTDKADLLSEIDKFIFALYDFTQEECYLLSTFAPIH